MVRENGFGQARIHWIAERSLRLRFGARRHLTLCLPVSAEVRSIRLISTHWTHLPRCTPRPWDLPNGAGAAGSRRDVGRHTCPGIHSRPRSFRRGRVLIPDASFPSIPIRLTHRPRFIRPPSAEPNGVGEARDIIKGVKHICLRIQSWGLFIQGTWSLFPRQVTESSPPPQIHRQVTLSTLPAPHWGRARESRHRKDRRSLWRPRILFNP